MLQANSRQLIFNQLAVFMCSYASITSIISLAPSLKLF